MRSARPSRRFIGYCSCRAARLRGARPGGGSSSPASIWLCDVRGQLDHHYPYPFIDIGKLGWTQVALNVAGIGFSFIVAGFGLVWIDRWRPLGPSGGRR